MNFNYKTSGDGYPFFFQHGLGGNLNQPQDLLGGLENIRLISMDCRGHGKTPFTKKEDLSFDRSADDVIALANHMGIEKAVYGGISMGAGIALNIAVRYPERVRALVLVRPAWLTEPNPANLRILQLLAYLISQKRHEALKETSEFINVERQSPGAAQAVLGQLNRDQNEHTAEILSAFTGDAPVREAGDLFNIGLPALIIATEADPMHPLAFGKKLSQVISTSVLKEAPSRYLDAEKHKRKVFESVQDFLTAILQ